MYKLKPATKFIQLDNGTVYHVRESDDKPRVKVKPMTDEQIRDSHDAYLRSLSHE